MQKAILVLGLLAAGVAPRLAAQTDYYLRAGAIASMSPIMREVSAFAAAGGPVAGICNGFQILCEAGLLPGVLRRNRDLEFVCRDVRVRVERADTAVTTRCEPGQELTIPVKHGEGCWYADEELYEELEAAGQPAGYDSLARELNVSATTIRRRLGVPI